MCLKSWLVKSNLNIGAAERITNHLFRLISLNYPAQGTCRRAETTPTLIDRTKENGKRLEGISFGYTLFRWVLQL